MEVTDFMAKAPQSYGVPCWQTIHLFGGSKLNQGKRRLCTSALLGTGVPFGMSAFFGTTAPSGASVPFRTGESFGTNAHSGASAPFVEYVVCAYLLDRFVWGECAFWD